MIRRAVLGCLLALAALSADASTIITRGGASAQGFGYANGGGSKKAFVAATTFSSNGASFVDAIPAGAQVGDVLVVFTDVTNPGAITTTTATATGSGVAMTANDCRTWLRTTLTDYACMFSKVLNSADVATGTVTITSSVANNVQRNAALYRGPGTVTTFKNFASVTAAGPTSIAFPGFAPTAGNKGVAALVIQNVNPPPTITATGWTMRSSIRSLYSGVVLDNMSYANATATFAGWDAVTPGIAGYMWEFN